MMFEAILTVKQTIAILAVYRGSYPGSKVRAGVVGAATSLAVLPLAVMMWTIISVVASVTVVTIVRSVHQGRDVY